MFKYNETGLRPLYKENEDTNKMHICVDCKSFRCTERRSDNVAEHYGKCLCNESPNYNRITCGNNWCDYGDITIN